MTYRIYDRLRTEVAEASVLSQPVPKRRIRSRVSCQKRARTADRSRRIQAGIVAPCVEPMQSILSHEQR